MVVLTWLVREERRWKVFVANRIAEIQRTTTKDIWHHVAGSENPADVSRGVLPEYLLKDDGKVLHFYRSLVPCGLQCQD